MKKTFDYFIERTLGYRFLEKTMKKGYERIEKRFPPQSGYSHENLLISGYLLVTSPFTILGVTEGIIEGGLRMGYNKYISISNI